MIPSKKSFESSINGQATSLYVLENSNSMQVAITNYGGRIVNIVVPDKDGKLTDVALGYNDLEQYLNDNDIYFGTITGRYANRIANGKFQLDGKDYQLTINNGSHCLHGGPTGFHARVWDAVKPDNLTLELYYTSKDGEEGFPGTLSLKVIYTLTDENSLKIEYFATTDKKTILNLTNHSYFNLNGHDAGDIAGHVLKINADRFTPTHEDYIPTGEINPVENTPFDFREPTTIGERIDLPDTQLVYGKGYNHNFVICGEENSLNLAATAIGPQSGIQMDVLTTEPGIQLYTGNFLNSKSSQGKGGRAYNLREGFCLETQHFPDSVNQPSFPTTILKPEEEYRSITIYKFSVVNSKRF